MSNDITELRSILFASLQELRDKNATVDLERIDRINNLAQTVISTAKVEVDHMRVTGTTSSSSFLPQLPPPTTKTMVPAPPSREGVAQQLIAANVTTHTMD